MPITRAHRTTLRRVLQAALPVVALSVSGCWLPLPSGGCTLEGCVRELFVSWPEPTTEPSRIVVRFGEEVLVGDCPGLEGWGDVYTEDADAGVNSVGICVATGFLLEGVSPSVLTVTRTSVSETQEWTVEPSYRFRLPNGEGCEPACLRGEAGAGFDLDPCRAAVWGVHHTCAGSLRPSEGEVTFCGSEPVCGSNGIRYAHSCDFATNAPNGTCPAAEPERCCGPAAE